MKEQYYYANLPTKLIKENFKNRRDRNQHLLAITIITSWVNTKTGTFYLSISKLAEELECSRKRAKTIIDNLIKLGYIQKISDAPNQYGQSVYKLLTYNWEEKMETAKETALETATETAPNKEYQYPEQIQETALETATETATAHQTKNNITNNKKTNNEITNNEKISNKEEFESVNVDFDLENPEEPLFDAYLQTFNAICPDKRVVALTDKRKQALKNIQSILEKSGVGWKEACNLFKNSSWLYSQTFATFDWFIKPENFVKVIEGQYVDKPVSEPEPEETPIIKAYSLSLIQKIKQHPFAQHHYKATETLSLFRKHYNSHSGDKVFISAPQHVHWQIERNLKDLIEDFSIKHEGVYHAAA
ncbi:helix-turn-helix domain-containing protein [Persephonella sp.]|uniref:helix-turn-helix domain-containing protein n=1 Tax=Persephonella sp. TaxID=2060922 RepID=UPI00262A738E|nr:helix-turn-helix domain-containing protein [Persephonella sp.]